MSAHTAWLRTCQMLVVVAALASSLTPALAVNDDFLLAAEQAVARFHAALTSGDRGGALALLADDVVVIENGVIESRADYAAQHLAADIDFARGIKVERSKPRTVVEGSTAWVSSEGPVKGEFKRRSVNMVTAELMVLSLHRGRWLIRAIHWSSRTP